jgi:hypothetical protein
MYKLSHKLNGKIRLTFDTLEDALRALQAAAVPALFYVSNANTVSNH